MGRQPLRDHLGDTRAALLFEQFNTRIIQGKDADAWRVAAYVRPFDMFVKRFQARWVKRCVKCI